MFEIIKAMVFVDLPDYLEALEKNPGYIDLLEPSEVIKGEEFESLEEARAEIDHVVSISITDDKVVIKYEYIYGSEDVYFNVVAVNGVPYPIESDMYSEDCYKAIKGSTL